MTDADRLDLLREYRAYAERTIERCDGTLKIEHLQPYHFAAARQRNDAARLAAHYSAQIERLEEKVCSSISPTPDATARSSRRSIAAYATAVLIWVRSQFA